jgi:hypothetical protein
LGEHGKEHHAEGHCQDALMVWKFRRQTQHRGNGNCPAETALKKLLLKAYLNFVVAGLVCGLIGLMRAVLSRSAAIAIGVCRKPAGCGEPHQHHRTGATVYLPGGTLNALVAGETSQLAKDTALILCILYGRIAIEVSIFTLRSQAITS